MAPAREAALEAEQSSGKGHEGVFVDAVTHVDVGRPLLRHGADRHRRPVSRRIVMTQVQACVVTEREYLADRAIELARIAAREVAARGAVVRREQRVTDECGVTEHIGHAIVRVPRRMHDQQFQLTQRAAITVREQAIELTPVGRPVTPHIEDVPEVTLHGPDAAADCDRGAELPCEPGRAAQVIRVGVCLEYPFRPDVLAADEIGQLRHRVHGAAAGGRIVVEDGIDDDTRSSPHVPCDMRPGAGLRVVERLDLRIAAHG